MCRMEGRDVEKRVLEKEGEGSSEESRCINEERLKGGRRGFERIERAVAVRFDGALIIQQVCFNLNQNTKV